MVALIFDIPEVDSMARRVIIGIVGEDWGSRWNAQMRQDMLAVLDLAAGMLLPYFDDPCALQIRVRRTHRNPEISYALDPDGAFSMALNTGEDYWAQMAYQLSHEFCHVLCNYRNQQWDEDKWFEEALCETASLFVLRSLLSVWPETSFGARHPHYRSRLEQYVWDTLGQPHRQLRDNESLGEWYEAHREHLRACRYERPLTQLIANQLLPLFEKSPSRWRALRYLNLGVATPQTQFPERLRLWSEQACRQFRAFVAELVILFGVAEEAAADQ